MMILHGLLKTCLRNATGQCGSFQRKKGLRLLMLLINEVKTQKDLIDEMTAKADAAEKAQMEAEKEHKEALRKAAAASVRDRVTTKVSDQLQRVRSGVQQQEAKGR